MAACSRRGGLGKWHIEVVRLPLSVHDSESGNIDDFFHGRAALQDVDRLRESHQNRAKSFRAADAQHELIGHVAGFEAGEDQNIGLLLQA